ncbi:type VI secretion system baseplate subunit TssG [Halomonas sp. MCCC 1A11036]|uniref:Type VI secretion system baseplate subunit TssG n=1 Tax=Billgrantia zhangzhouensis TaxID=2733481 RepID=A0ABS9A9B4_9GAMM|nr:type VI secretion system baseplate subunit TssG [Halomonas zhangzhouensis]MCE8018512.1 type VI secretion system baseplate subunit TssG [Halomonas zhangzhouensis]
MATQNRHSAPGLIDRARAEPYRFGFFQLVRLFRLHYSHLGRLDPESRPHEDPLRFRTKLSLEFPASEISDLVFENPKRLSPLDQPLTEIQVTFMGLVGPSGVLPRPYTETLIDRHIQLRDDAAHAFLDLFSHRMTALFYQAWQKYRFFIEYERKGEADFERQLHALVGLSERSTQLLTRRHAEREHDADLPRELLGYFAGILSQRPRNILNLQALLGSIFGVDCRVRPFSGRWLAIPEREHTRLGARNACLGETAVAGTRVWDYQSCARIVLGPLSRANYQRFLPGQPDHARLVELTRFYLGVELDFELELELEAGQISAARLGGADGVALGRLGWLGTRAHARNGHAIFPIPFNGATT